MTYEMMNDQFNKIFGDRGLSETKDFYYKVKDLQDEEFASISKNSFGDYRYGTNKIRGNV